MKNHPIGFLDSGVGGLTVVKEVMKQLPNETIYYIGDSARNPYGPRPMAEVEKFTHQLADFLLTKEIKVLVIACNTATVAALKSLQETLPIPVIGVIESGSKAANDMTNNHKVGVIGTDGTIESNEYELQIISHNQETDVLSVACPRFVSVVEKNQFESSLAKKIVQNELEPFKDTDIDTLVLGCTHYPLLQPIIQDYFGQQVHLIDPGVETAKTVKEYLTQSNLLNQRQNQATNHILYTSGSAEEFNRIAKKWLNGSNFEVEHISVKELR